MKIDLSTNIQFPSYDFDVITRLDPLQYVNPTEAMMMFEDSSNWFLHQYYLNSKVFLRFPRALPTRLKGIAV